MIAHASRRNPFCTWGETLTAPLGDGESSKPVYISAVETTSPTAHVGTIHLSPQHRGGLSSCLNDMALQL